MKNPRSRIRAFRNQLAKSKFRRAMLACEQLELRQLLAADILGMVCNEETAQISLATAGTTAKAESIVVEATHHYMTSGEQVDMHIHPTRIALSIANGVSNGKALLAASGFEFVRTVDSNFAVFEGSGDVEAQAASLKVSGLIDAAIPVFVLEASNSEAVLVDELIVSLEPGTSAETFFGKNESTFSAYRRLDGTPNQFVATVAAGQGAVALQVLNDLQASKLDGVQWIEPNFYQNWQKHFIPNDTRFGNQWHLHNVGQGGSLVDADSDLPEAWDLNQGGSPDYVIGIVDDSIAAHPDLSRWVNAGEVAGNGLDDDGNGWVDDINGWNFVSNNNLSGPTTDDDVHGTAVAGVAAAIGNNALGVAGASYRARVSVSRMFEGTGVASDANIAAALYYQAGRTADGLGTWDSADVINNSWGGGGNSTAINDALSWGTSSGRMGAGAPIFFSSGNGFSSVVGYPSSQSATNPGLFSIGATNSLGERSDYSNFGTALDFVTPSNDTRPGYLAIDTTDRQGPEGYDGSDYTGTGVNGFGGTSSASPLAAGIAALVMDQADDMSVVLSPAVLKNYLHQTTDIIGGVVYDTATGKNLEFGYGRLNAFTAVSGVGKAEISVISSTEDLVSGVSTDDLGEVYVGQFNDVTYRVRNQGTSTLELTSLAIAGADFSVLSGFSDSSLSVGEAATFVVRYLPTAFGSDSAEVTIGSSDLDEGSFTFDITGTALVRSVSGYVIEDWDGDDVLDPQDGPQVGKVVFIDANENGTFDDSVAVFTQPAPTSILDNQVVTSTLAVTGVVNPIQDVNVRINITHTWNSDLDVTLVSPTGERILLLSAVGGSFDNFTNTVFDDEASTPINLGTAPFTGSFRPAEPLSILDGEIANGTWSLEVQDFATGDEGTLNDWSLTFAVGENFTTSDSTGYYFFDSLPNGSYQVRSILTPGWQATGDNLNEFTITTPDDFFVNQDFGTAKNDRFYGLVFGDTDGDGVWGMTEAPLEDRVVFIDSNGNTELDPGVTNNFVNNTPTAIFDLTTVTSTINITGVTSPILDVNVRVNITHTWDSDLDVFLVHPDGTRVELFTDVGGSGLNFTDTVLDDQAATSIATGSAPFTGTFRPEGSLATLFSKSVNGTWTLEIFDDAGGDEGTVNEWELIITSGELSSLTDALGRVSYDLPAGTHEMFLQSVEGWTHTVPSDGHRTAPIAGAPLVNQTFGSTNVPIDAVPPTLSAPMFVGSSWPANFKNFVAGSNLGVSVTPGMLPIVYNDVNTLFLQFSEDVTNVSSSTVELRSSVGVVPITVSYNASTFVATITLASPLGPSKYRLAASDLITDAAGNALDGDGAGGAGGLLNLRFDVLPADFNGDRRVNGSDLIAFGASFNSQVGQPAYNSRLDWDADGRVNGVDLAVFSPLFNVRIDTLSDPGAPFGGGGGGAALLRAGGFSNPRDDFFKGFGDDDDDKEEGFELF